MIEVSMHEDYIEEVIKVQQYGGFLKRFAAYLVDSLVFVVPSLFVSESDAVTLFLFVALWTAYCVWMNGAYGATVGKMVVKLKIVKEDGSKISYSDALLREIASMLSTVVLGLGYLNIIWDKRKQGWHDKIAKTVVVRL